MVDGELVALVNDELRVSNELVVAGYFGAERKLVVKRGRYGIDCRVVPDNQLLCIEMDNELFVLMFSKKIPDCVVRAIFHHMGVA